MDIKSVLARRTDLSTFLVHLTRGQDPPQSLRDIISNRKIEARTAFGQAAPLLSAGPAQDSQKVVCFTETPLEHINLLIETIDGRRVQYKPYGIAFPKYLARQRGVNPVWYLDITPGHTWVTQSVDQLIKTALQTGNFQAEPISNLTPFIEQMGTGNGYQKEFWWEREWRHVGDFSLPERFIGLAPAGEIPAFEALSAQNGFQVKFIDPSWGLEQIIGALAGFTDNDISPF